MFWINYARKAVNRLSFGRKFNQFETDVGLKYYNSPFHSDKFSEYPVESRLNGGSVCDLQKFICPPDMLKNEYTWAGTEIISSPHFELMRSLCDGQLNYSNPYLINARQGTLDARPPQNLKTNALEKIFSDRKKSFLGDEPIIVNALKLSRDSSGKIMILDGKHRLALALALNLESRITVQFLPNTFASHTFFRAMYGAVLDHPKEFYSINQSLILKILGDS